MARIVLTGEAMLELSRQGGGWRIGQGGDTLNPAIHLARSGHDAAYLTAIGSNPLSADLKPQWQAEGLGTALVLTHPDRATGLYAITTDPHGERSFTYWRDGSAAREMFALPAMADALATAEQAALLVFSLISLAILPADARESLLALAMRLARARRGHAAARAAAGLPSTAITGPACGLRRTKRGTGATGRFPPPTSACRRWTTKRCSAPAMPLVPLRIGKSWAAPRRW